MMLKIASSVLGQVFCTIVLVTYCHLYGHRHPCIASMHGCAVIFSLPPPHKTIMGTVCETSQHRVYLPPSRRILCRRGSNDLRRAAFGETGKLRKCCQRSQPDQLAP